jgi:hypothetical protein
VDNSRNRSYECLNTLHVVGTALVFAPIIIALPAILYAAISGKSIGIDVGEAQVRFRFDDNSRIYHHWLCFNKEI